MRIHVLARVWGVFLGENIVKNTAFIVDFVFLGLLADILFGLLFTNAFSRLLAEQVFAPPPGPRLVTPTALGFFVIPGGGTSPRPRHKARGLLGLRPSLKILTRVHFVPTQSGR